MVIDGIEEAIHEEKTLTTYPQKGEAKPNVVKR